MSKQTNLLIEIAMEELPTAAVADLSNVGKTLWCNTFNEVGIYYDSVDTFATPRRLAWRFNGIALMQDDQTIERKGPSLKAAKDKDGQWTKAALGFASSCGVDPETLQIEETPKGAWLMFYGVEKGQPLKTLLPSLFEQVMHKLPIAKRMRWGDFEQSFVRPVLALVVLADTEIWPLSFFGVESDRKTLGHRVHHPDPVLIDDAKNYESVLKAAHVIACMNERQESIRQQVTTAAKELGGQALMPDHLIEEVSALVEWPVAVAGHFEPRFLEVPQEVLITTMQDNQKTFAVMDKNGKMMPHFIAIANLESKNPEIVRKGNEKVIRPRFADAEFFWQQDLKKPLATHQSKLSHVVYQDKLGSLADKSQRVAKLAATLAPLFNADPKQAYTAAELAKCDLLSEMVMEFPELQGLMGRYYALHDGLDSDIAYAIEEQYYPLQSGGSLPTTTIGRTLALAEKIDTILGGFAIGAKPTGSRDPYALRRMSIGVIRLIIENHISLSLKDLLSQAAKTFPSTLNVNEQIDDVCQYILERLQGYYREQGIAMEVFQAVQALQLDDLNDIDARVQVLAQFSSSPQAQNLLESAKRIRNILKKRGEVNTPIRSELLQDSAEQILYQAWQTCYPILTDAIKQHDYTRALNTLTTLGQPLATFFNDVMVMSENEALRMNRLAMLTELQHGFSPIADLSLLTG